MKKILIVYYSWSNGNTRRIAETLKNVTNGDIAEINTIVPYSGSYDEVVAQGKREADSGYEPAIQPLSANLDAYDVIAVGTPTWWYTMAPAVRTFLYHTNWKGKTVVPFMTNGGWPGHVIADMKKACAGADFACEKEIQFDSEGGDHLETPEEEIRAWGQNVNNLL